jgi:DNA-binding MarR family transcriptional regulator
VNLVEAASRSSFGYGAAVGERWTFLSNHTHVLIAVARNPDARLSDLSESTRLSERGVQIILTDLEREGYLTRRRVGRRNHYVIDTARGLRHPNEAHHSVGELIDLFDDPSSPELAPELATESGTESSRLSRSAGAASAAVAAAAAAVADVASSGVPDLPL